MHPEQTERLIKAVNRNSHRLELLCELLENRGSLIFETEKDDEPDDYDSLTNLQGEFAENTYPPMESESDKLSSALNELDKIRSTFSDPAWQRFKALMGKM